VAAPRLRAVVALLMAAGVVAGCGAANDDPTVGAASQPPAAGAPQGPTAAPTGPQHLAVTGGGTTDATLAVGQSLVVDAPPDGGTVMLQSSAAAGSASGAADPLATAGASATAVTPGRALVTVGRRAACSPGDACSQAVQVLGTILVTVR
jgi:hypothetical protein